MKSKRKTKTRKPARAASKKARPRRKAKNDGSNIPVIYQRRIEQQFIGEHPEAFDPFIGEWIVLEGRSIVAHGMNATVVAEEARSRGVRVPYMFRVVPRLNPNEGYLF